MHLTLCRSQSSTLSSTVSNRLCPKAPRASRSSLWSALISFWMCLLLLAQFLLVQSSLETPTCHRTGDVTLLVFPVLLLFSGVRGGGGQE